MQKTIALTILIVFSGIVVSAVEETNATSSAIADADARPDITTLNGATYQRCKISRISPDGISIFHSKGIAKIPFTDLSDEYQKKYGYDPVKSAAYRQHVKNQQAAAYSRRQKQQAEQRKQHAQNQQAATQKAAAEEAAKPPKPTGPAVPILGKVLQVLEDGIILTDVAIYARDQKKAHSVYNSPLSGSRGFTYYVKKNGRYLKKTDKLVFVYTDPKPWGHGDKFDQTIGLVGHYSYTTVMGSTSKLTAYTTRKK